MTLNTLTQAIEEARKNVTPQDQGTLESTMKSVNKTIARTNKRLQRIIQKLDDIKTNVIDRFLRGLLEPQGFNYQDIEREQHEKTERQLQV